MARYSGHAIGTEGYNRIWESPGLREGFRRLLNREDEIAKEEMTAKVKTFQLLNFYVTRDLFRNGQESFPEMKNMSAADIIERATRPPQKASAEKYPGRAGLMAALAGKKQERLERVAANG